VDTISTLLEFIERARSERKYADSTARGLVAAVKLFAGYINDAERSDFDVLLLNLDNIAGDIYAKHAGENITVTTLVVYKRRLRKLVGDYHEYGTSPEKMAAWNPRRTAPAMRSKRSAAAPASTSTSETAEMGAAGDKSPVLLQPARVSETNQAGVVALDGGDTRIVMNRSEISLRPNLRIALELPADMSEQEAAKIKQLIDIMLPPS
jgi:hypothetical protein